MDHAKRRNTLRAAIGATDADALLVTSGPNVRYLSGFTGSYGILVIGVDAAADLVVTDGRYETQVAAEAGDLPAFVAHDLPKALIARLADGGAARRIAFEAAHVDVAQHGEWVKAAPAIEWVATTGLVEALRRVKDAEEIELLSTACAASQAALEALLPTVASGQSEHAITRRLENLLYDNGCDGLSFDMIVATGPHSAIPHHSPGQRTVERGDLLKIDFGGTYGGYHADMTRTFGIGVVTDWQREIHDAVRVAQAAGCAAAIAGARLADIDAAARGPITAAGHGDRFVHGIGHALGLEIHERPFVNRDTPGTLDPGTAITIEPGIYLPGRGGVRIEDVVVPLPDGSVRNLMTMTRDLVVLDT